MHPASAILRRVTPLTPPAIEAYLSGLIPPRDAVLKAMEARAKRERIPIVGPQVGSLLHQLVRMTGARRVFECGSAIGYSTIWLARAVGPKGRVFYTEMDAGRIADARGYLRRAGVLSRVTLLEGPALASLKRTSGVFDAVFCDADKEGYPAYWKEARSRIRPGGLFLCDNTLWSGRVADPRVKDASTRGIRAMTRALAADRRYLSSLIPLRDGLTVAWRRS